MSNVIEYNENIEATTDYTYAKSYNWLLKRKELSHICKSTYARLRQFGGKNGIAFPSRETLAEELGAKISVIDRALRTLIKYNLIVVRRRGCNKSNEYIFPTHIWMKNAPTYEKRIGIGVYKTKGSGVYKIVYSIYR